MKSLSLSMRVTLLLGAAVVVIVGGAALLVDRMVDTEVIQRMDTALLTQAQTLVSVVDIDTDGLHMGDIQKPVPHLHAGQSVEFWAVHCANGNAVTSQPPPPAYPARWFKTARNKPSFTYVGKKRDALRAVWFKFKTDGDDDPAPRQPAEVAVPCSVLFMHTRDAMNDILSDIDGVLLSIPLLALLAVLLLSPVLVRRGLRPLALLGEAMRGIGPRSPGRRLQTTGAHELEPLVGRFNEVLARMDEGVARERQFAGALAHETRTHLTELRSLVEVEQRYPGGTSLDDILDEIGSIVGELQGTVSGLLLLTRLEAGIEGMDRVDVKLGEVVNRQLASVATLLRERRLHLDRAATGPDTVLVADRALLDIVIGNLLHNAVAYAPEGSTIAIRQQPHALVITNDAPDVDGDEVKRFGQRFWSKHHDAGGHAGLGLALAGAATAAMDLDLRFSLDEQQHLHASLSWPDAR